MSKNVILSERSGVFRHWGEQYVSAESNHRDIIVAGRLARNASQRVKLAYINRYYQRAAQAAGSEGTVIISLGHGGSSDTDPTVGMVDLLPNRTLRIQREELRYEGSDAQQGYENARERVSHFRPNQCRRILRQYDLDPNTRRPQPPAGVSAQYFSCSSVAGGRTRAQTNELFMRIGNIFRDAGISKVVFLTCRVGAATSFLQRLSQHWHNITIAAYQRRVAANRDDDRENPYYLYLVGDERRHYRTDLPNRYLYET